MVDLHDNVRTSDNVYQYFGRQYFTAIFCLQNCLASRYKEIEYCEASLCVGSAPADLPDPGWRSSPDLLDMTRSILQLGPEGFLRPKRPRPEGVSRYVQRFYWIPPTDSIIHGFSICGGSGDGRPCRYRGPTILQHSGSKYKYFVIRTCNRVPLRKKSGGMNE